MLTTTFRLVLIGCLGFALVFGQDPPPKDRVAKGREFLGLAAPPDPQAAARGQKQFLQNCAFCHGQNATGAEGPDLVRSGIVLHDERGELIGQVLLKGRPDRGMPAFPSFSADQVQDIAAFLHARVEAAANRWGYKVQNVVTGDAQQGELFYRQHCTKCHSTTGDLAHIGRKFEPADLQAAFLYPYNAKVERKATVTLPDGTKVSGTLREIDDFTVALMDESGRDHSWAREKIRLQLTDPLAGHRALLDVYTNTDMHNMLAFLETLK